MAHWRSASRRRMVGARQTPLDLRPQGLAGDSAYGAERLLKWLVDRKITPHIPVWDKSKRRDGSFSRADFVFDRERNIYVCPDRRLTSAGNIDQGTSSITEQQRHDCSTVHRSQSARQRSCKITRDVNEDCPLTASGALGQLPRRFRQLMALRDQDKSRCNAHMKRILTVRPSLRLRGLIGASDERCGSPQPRRHLRHSSCCSAVPARSFAAACPA